MSRNSILAMLSSLMSMPGGMGKHTLAEASRLNSEYMDRARGKGKGGGGKSIAMQARHTNPKYPVPHQGAKECARRREQNHGKTKFRQ